MHSRARSTSLPKSKKKGVLSPENTKRYLGVVGCLGFYGSFGPPSKIQLAFQTFQRKLVQVKRQWDIAQCTMDAIDAARSVAALGLTLDLLSRPGEQVTTMGGSKSSILLGFPWLVLLP